MAAKLTTITNVSNQPIPVLVNETTTAGVNASSNLAKTVQGQITIPAGKQLVVETARVDLAQLERLRQLNLITFSGTAL